MRFDRDLDIKYNKSTIEIQPKYEETFPRVLNVISDTIGLLSRHVIRWSLVLVMKSPYVDSINTENHTPVDQPKAGDANENS